MKLETYLKSIEEEILIRNHQLNCGSIQHLFVVGDDFKKVFKSLKKMNVLPIEKEKAKESLYYSDNFSLLRNKQHGESFCLDILLDEYGFCEFAVFTPYLNSLAKYNPLFETIEKIKLNDFLGNSAGVYSILDLQEKRFLFCYEEDSLYNMFYHFDSYIKTKERDNQIKILDFSMK